MEEQDMKWIDDYLCKICGRYSVGTLQPSPDESVEPCCDVCFQWFLLVERGMI